MATLWKVLRAAFDGESRLLSAQITANTDAGDTEGDALTVDEAVVYQQLGVAVRPKIVDALRSTLSAFGVDYGAAVAILKLWDHATSPTDLEEGETRVYAAGAVANVVRLLLDKVVVQAARIDLGAGATKKVARLGDTVRVTIPTGTQFTMTIPGVGTVTASTTVAVTADGTVTSGSNTVFAKD